MKIGSNSIQKASLKAEDCPRQYRETNCLPTHRRGTTNTLHAKAWQLELGQDNMGSISGETSIGWA